jgi:uncharacterized SAM-binding protein YcdF (DUF218 family)
MTTLFLTKLLSVFVYPLGAAILIGIAAFLMSFTRWRCMEKGLLGFALAALWIASTPLFAGWLTWRVESKLPLLSMESLPQSDVMILLGGATGNRILDVLQIYHAGKAPLIVISGGNLPWDPQAVPESQLIAGLLAKLGVPRSVLVLETGSRTTRENAINTAAIFKEHGWRNGLLVTSGVHMPRALATFQKVGLRLVPAAADIYGGPRRFDTLLDVVPDAGALARTVSAVKEIIGLCVYRSRGWA